MSKEEKQQWLDNLVEGDEVLIRNRIQALVVKVSRITKTRRIFVDYGLKFNSDGSPYGQGNYSWQIGSWSIEPITKEYWQEVDMKQMIYKINDVNWNTVSYEKLKNIIDTLEGKK